MGLGSDGCEAISEYVVFLRYFEDLPDPRQRAKGHCHGNSPWPEAASELISAAAMSRQSARAVARRDFSVGREVRWRWTLK